MISWHELLTRHSDQPNGTTDLPAGPHALVAPRPDLRILRLAGGDWRKLLQGQTTCDVELLTPDRSLNGALCTAKGRMIANFHLVQDADDVLIITQSSTLDTLRTTLARFAPFFKTTLVQDDNRLLATVIQPDNTATLARTLTGKTFTNPLQVHSWEYGKTVLVSDRQLLCILECDHERALQALQSAAALTDTNAAWLAAIRDGQGWVTENTVDEFIPQMLALHLTGAVSFKKGCYTGQEVVARMHYLGKLKRQLTRLELDTGTLPAPGTECHLPGDKQNCGHIVMAASTPEGRVEALAVLTEQGAASDVLTLGELGKVAQRRLSLPLADDTT